MKIHIYDTHVHTTSGEYIHFDVLVNDDNISHVRKYADEYLASLDIKLEQITQGRCNFCHSEAANPKVQEDILIQGYSIIRLS
jgi:hypothetical protein